MSLFEISGPAGVCAGVGEQESAGSAGLREGRARLPRELAGGRSGSEFVNSRGPEGPGGTWLGGSPGGRQGPVLRSAGHFLPDSQLFGGQEQESADSGGLPWLGARNSKFAIISTFGVIFLLSGALFWTPSWRFFGVNSSNFDVELVIFLMVCAKFERWFCELFDATRTSFMTFSVDFRCNSEHRLSEVL